MTVHELKCWPEAFQAKVDGRKPWEFRKTDRDFQEGDTIVEREWAPSFDESGNLTGGEYTGRTVEEVVTFILRGPGFGIPDGYCIMTTERVDTVTVPLEVRSWTAWDDRPRYSVSLIPPSPNGSVLVMPGDSLLEAREKMRTAFVDAYQRYTALPESPIATDASATPNQAEGRP